MNNCYLPVHMIDHFGLFFISRHVTTSTIIVLLLELINLEFDLDRSCNFFRQSFLFWYLIPFTPLCLVFFISTYSSPFMKTFECFNFSATYNGIKKTILDEMNNILVAIASTPFVLVSTNTFFVQSKIIIDYMLALIESLFQELKENS